jgi:transposase
MFVMDRDSLARWLEAGESVEKIAARVDRHPSTVAYWMKKFGLEAPNRAKHAARGGIERERLTELVEHGHSTAEIAALVNRSTATVRHWLRRYGLRTRPSDRISVRRRNRRHGKATVLLTCARHGETEFVLEGRGYYRCKLCRQERVAERRRRIKAILVAEAGGACCLCGYSRYVGALEFHHVDPRQKRLELSHKGLGLSIDTARAEARKCVLVCSNCHAELEGQVVSLPARVDGSARAA